MGSRFLADNEQPSTSEPKIAAPAPAYGLSSQQMAALGLTKDSYSKATEADEELLRATAWYSQDKVSDSNRMVTRMSGLNTHMSGWQPATGANRLPGQKPPDLPSLLLDARIVYIGMPLVSSVAELLISELLWLNYSEPHKPVYLYINSEGTQGPGNQALAFETDAYTVLDTLRYIKPEIQTLNVGKAYGTAAMLLASGVKGKRCALDHSQIMTAPPRMNRSFGNVTNMMIKANELEYNTDTYCDFMSQFTGKDKETMRKDMGRNRYFTPTQAIEYGIIDKVIKRGEQSFMESKKYPEARSQASQQRAQQRVPAGASAEGGY